MRSHGEQVQELIPVLAVVKHELDESGHPGGLLGCRGKTRGAQGVSPTDFGLSEGWLEGDDAGMRMAVAAVVLLEKRRGTGSEMVEVQQQKQFISVWRKAGIYIGRIVKKPNRDFRGDFLENTREAIRMEMIRGDKDGKRDGHGWIFGSGRPAMTPDRSFPTGRPVTLFAFSLESSFMFGDLTSLTGRARKMGCSPVK